MLDGAMGGHRVQTPVILQQLMHLCDVATPVANAHRKVFRGVGDCSNNRRLQLSLPRRTAGTAVLLKLVDAKACAIVEKHCIDTEGPYITSAALDVYALQPDPMLLIDTTDSGEQLVKSQRLSARSPEARDHLWGVPNAYQEVCKIPEK